MPPISVHQQSQNLDNFIRSWMVRNPELKLVSVESNSLGYFKLYRYQIGRYIEIDITVYISSTHYYDTTAKIGMNGQVIFSGDLDSLAMFAEKNSITFGYASNELEMNIYRVANDLILIADNKYINGWMSEKVSFANVLPYTDLVALDIALKSFYQYTEINFPPFDSIAILSVTEALRLFRRKIQFELRQDKNSSLLKYLVFSEVDPRIVEYILESEEQNDSTEADFIHLPELSFATELNIYFDIAYQHMPLTQTVLFGWKTTDNEIFLALTSIYGFRLPSNVLNSISAIAS